MLPPVTPKKQYWDVALASLSPALQAAITSQAGNHVDILESVLKEAYLKRAICLNKRWRFKNSKGEIIILRDVMEKIIRWLDKFKAVGDIAVGFDQTQASLPWAAVRFLLTCASSDVKAFGAILETVELVTHLIAKYREFERLYLTKTSALENQLEISLVRLYAVILEALGSAMQALDESTVHRLIKSPFRIADDYIPKMKEMEVELLKLAGLIDSEVMRSLHAMSLRLIDSVRSYDTSVGHERYQKILTWLSTTNCSTYHASVSARRITDTANWLFGHRQFLSWIHSSSSSILLLHGVAGSGKTMLSSKVIDGLLSQRHDHHSAVPFAYFYCSANALEPERAQPENIMRNLLRQLVMLSEPAPLIREKVLYEYDRRERLAGTEGIPESQIERLGLDDCHRLMMDVTNSDPITIIIDAIDEISNDQRYKLLYALDQIAKDSANLVKILVTSRDDHQILSLLDNAPKVRISAIDNRADVQSFVAFQIESAVCERRLLNGTVTPALREELESFLLSGSGEMFLWAKVQLEFIIRMRHRQDILRTIRERQHITLDGLYGGIVQRIFDAGSASRALAIRSFTWLIFAREALTPPSYLIAINRGSMDEPMTLDEIESVCYNLIVHDADQVRFVHQSAQDFVSQLDEFSIGTGNKILAEACLRSCINGESDPSTDGVFEFQRYCSMYWAEHYNRCKTFQNTSSLEALLDGFVFEPGDDSTEPAFSFIAWHDSIRPIAESLPWDHPSYQDLDAIPGPNASPFFMACTFGIFPLVQRITSASTDFDWNCINDSGHTGLCLASYKGHSEIVELLLEHGANPGFICGTQGNALNAACSAGHKHIVELLLSHHNAHWDSHAYAKALDISFEHLHEDVALTIVSRKIGNYNEDEYACAISGASQAGFISVVEVLRKSRYQESSKDRVRENYKIAIQNGRVSMLRFMLQKFSHTSADLPDDGVALAAQHGQTDTVAFLLDLGLNIEQEGQLGTPLRVASMMDHSSTILMLIERGAKVNAKTSYGTALNAASMKGNVHAVRILIDNGANASQSDFVAAALNRHLAVTEILVSVGSDFQPVKLRPAQWHRWCEITPYLMSKGLLEYGGKRGDRAGYN